MEAPVPTFTCCVCEVRVNGGGEACADCLACVAPLMLSRFSRTHPTDAVREERSAKRRLVPRRAAEVLPPPTFVSLPAVLLEKVAEKLAPADACRLGFTTQSCRAVAHSDALWTRTLLASRALATLTVRLYKSATLERTRFHDDESTWLVRKLPAVAQPGLMLLPWRTHCGEAGAPLPGALRKYVECAGLQCSHCAKALLAGSGERAGAPVSTHGCPLCADGRGPRLMAALSEPGGLSKCKAFCGRCHCSCACSICAMDEATAVTLTGRSLATMSCAQVSASRLPFFHFARIVLTI